MSRLRRVVICCFVLLSGVMLLASCGKKKPAASPKVIVIGFDGMDPVLAERLMDAGDLPHFASLRDRGGYRRLGTTIPPQSPVAWASFITGADPGVHGIFDFIHRNPAKQCEPYYSAAETVEGDKGWDVGAHDLPLTFWPFNHQPTQTLLRREGTPFWDYLDAAGVRTRFYDLPANYPPSESHHGHMCCLSGMGVPDLRGTYGTYQHFSELTFLKRDEPGGMRHPLVFRDHAANAVLVGPANTALKKPADVEVPFRIHRHPTDHAARIELQGRTIVLQAGEWSDWQKVEFNLSMPPFLPDARVSGICRFYLQQVHPDFALYVTPINIDPSDPGDQKISEPPTFVTEISSRLGLFYTAGFQEDHKALSNRVFTDAEYQAQADYVLKERLDLLEDALDQYQDGLLFFYFSSTDLQAHMFWWDSDDPHPVRTPQEARRYHAVIEDLYRRMDAVVGDVLRRFGDEAVILLMSDHGFSNFRRQFNLNTWLRDQGYLHPPDARSLLSAARRPLVDWSQTRAYGLGLNGLYLNLTGRERDGIVSTAERDALLDELSAKLLAVRDPVDGRPVIARVYRSDEVYSGPQTVHAPDLIVGYHRDYRASWATTLGDITDDWISDNDEAWSGDHCMAAELVPGVLFSNRPIALDAPSLIDLAPTVLRLFRVAVPETMVGSDLFEQRAVADGGDRPGLRSGVTTHSKEKHGGEDQTR